MRSGLVYIVSDGTACKVGVSGDVRTRLSALQSSNPRQIELVALLSVVDGQAYDFERGLKANLQHRRIHGEWFNVTPDQAAAALIDVVPFTVPYREGYP